MWEEIKPREKPCFRAPPDSVSLYYDSKTIQFNTQVVDKYKLDQVRYVKVRVNKAQNTLGLALMRNGKDSNVYRLSSAGGDSRAFTLACKQGLQRLGSPRPGYYRLKEEAHDFLVINFNIFLGELKSAKKNKDSNG